MFDLKMNALIFMHANDFEPRENLLDWKVLLMSRVVELIQESQTGFVPIFSPFTDQNPRMLVPQLSKMMDVQAEELPQYFVLHPITDQVVPYPHPLDDPAKFTPELVLLWGRRTVLYLDIEHFEQELSTLEKKKTDDADNFSKEDEQRIAQLKEILPAAEEEKKVVIEKHAEIEAALAEKNTWLESVNELIAKVEEEKVKKEEE